MQRAQLGPPMVHLTKFHQNRLKDLGARRVDDRHTHTDRQTNAGNNKGNPSDRANKLPNPIWMQTQRQASEGISHPPHKFFQR